MLLLVVGCAVAVSFLLLIAIWMCESLYAWHALNGLYIYIYKFDSWFFVMLLFSLNFHIPSYTYSFQCIAIYSSKHSRKKRIRKKEKNKHTNQHNTMKKAKKNEKNERNYSRIKHTYMTYLRL